MVRMITSSPIGPSVRTSRLRSSTASDSTLTAPGPGVVEICASLAHDPDEILRMDPHSNDIPYNWSRQDG